jgi:hypothetical protein
MCSHGSEMTEQPVCFVAYSASDFAGSAYIPYMVTERKQLTSPIRDFSEHSRAFFRRFPVKVLHTQWVMNTRPALWGSKGVSTGVALRQRV